MPVAMLHASGCVAQRGMKGWRSSAHALTKWTSPAVMHVPLENTQKNKKDLTTPFLPSKLAQRHGLFSIYFLLKRPRTYI